MAPSKGFQLALICSIGALFFVAAISVDRGVSPAVLGGACVIALVLIFLIARRAQPAPAATEQPSASRRKTHLRTLAVLAGLGLLEVTQLAAASFALKAACVTAAIALFLWAIVVGRK